MADERIKATTQPMSHGTNITRAKGRRKGAPVQIEQTDANPNVTRDSVREILETVVFVVILVLLLKTFIAEAFVIPTGSMANTLYGHHEKVTCTQCGITFPVNTSREVEEKGPQMVNGCECPNCRNRMSPLPGR